MEKRALLQNLAAGVLGSLSVGTISVAAEDSDPDEYTTAETAENPVHSTVAFTAIDETERLALYLGTDMETEEDEPAEVQKIISSDDGSVLGIEWQNENELSFNQGIKEKILTISAGGNVGSIQEADSSSGGDVGINAVIPSLPGGSEEDENYDGGDWGDGTDNSGNTGDGGDDGGSGIGWDGDIGNPPGLGEGSSGGEEDKPDWVNEWENNPDERDQFWDGNANTDGKGLSDLLDGIGLCENSKAGEVCVNFGSMGPKFYADCEGQGLYLLGIELSAVEIAGTWMGGFSQADFWIGYFPPENCLYWGSEDENICKSRCHGKIKAADLEVSIKNETGTDYWMDKFSSGVEFGAQVLAILIIVFIAILAIGAKILDAGLRGGIGA